MRSIEKASGRQAASAASGISLPDRTRRPPAFSILQLTESLEQATLTGTVRVRYLGVCPLQTIPEQYVLRYLQT